MGFLTRCKRPFLFAFLLQFCNMLFSFFLKTFLILFEKQQPGFSKARLGARRLLVSTTGKKFSRRRLYIPANNCYTETSSYTIPRTVMVAMIRS